MREGEIFIIIVNDAWNKDSSIPPKKERRMTMPIPIIPGRAEGTIAMESHVRVQKRTVKKVVD